MYCVAEFVFPTGICIPSIFTLLRLCLINPTNDDSDDLQTTLGVEGRNRRGCRLDWPRHENEGSSGAYGNNDKRRLLGVEH